MIDNVRLQVLIGIQSALLGEAVPSLYAVTFETSKPLLNVYWYIDNDVTDEIENHFYGFLAALHDQISDDFWMTWDLYHAISTLTNDSEFSGKVVYLRRTDKNVLFNSSAVQIKSFCSSCKQTSNRFQMCTLSCDNISYHDFISGDDYLVNRYILLKDNNLSLVYPIRPKIANDKLKEISTYQSFIPSTIRASADWFISRINTSLILQKILLGTICPTIHQIWVKGAVDKVDVVLYADDLTNAEVLSTHRSISALLCAEFPENETSCLLEYASKNEVVILHDPWFPVHLAPKM